MSAYGYNPQTTSNGSGLTTGGPTGTPDERARFVEYTCGDCDTGVFLKRGEPIRCRNCGHRVLYKRRTNRMVQFEAR